MSKPKMKPIVIVDSSKTEFENFQEFAKKLFRVPKSELDKINKEFKPSLKRKPMPTKS